MTNDLQAIYNYKEFSEKLSALRGDIISKSSTEDITEQVHNKIIQVIVEFNNLLPTLKNLTKEEHDDLSFSLQSLQYAWHCKLIEYIKYLTRPLLPEINNSAQAQPTTIKAIKHNQTQTLMVEWLAQYRSINKYFQIWLDFVAEKTRFPSFSQEVVVSQQTEKLKALFNAINLQGIEKLPAFINQFKKHQANPIINAQDPTSKNKSIKGKPKELCKITAQELSKVIGAIIDYQIELHFLQNCPIASDEAIKKTISKAIFTMTEIQTKVFNQVKIWLSLDTSNAKNSDLLNLRTFKNNLEVNLKHTPSDYKKEGYTALLEKINGLLSNAPLFEADTFPKLPATTIIPINNRL